MTQPRATTMIGACLLGMAGGLVLASGVRAQTEQEVAAPGVSISAGGAGEAGAIDWGHYNWLSNAGADDSFSVGQVRRWDDPFALVADPTLWNNSYQARYTRRLGDGLSLTYDTRTGLADDSLPGGADDVSREQNVGFQFQPSSALTLTGSLHNADVDLDPASPSTVTGTFFGAEGQLPLNAKVSLNVSSSRSETERVAGSSDYRAYDAQFQQPLGSLPFSAVFKGHYEETTAAGAPMSRMPSLEQAIVWKPGTDTTLQVGLRQQHYQDFPGLENQFNETVFADWSQRLLPSVTWHSYAELVNTRGTEDADLASSSATGTGPTSLNNTSSTDRSSLSSALSLPGQDKTISFSTGPSFLLQKDLSASIEYSNRWDQNPASGTPGQEQRVSVSLKGSF